MLMKQRSLDMLVKSLTEASTVVAPKSDAEKAGLNYDAFLKLMLAQLKAQDPLNPVDQTESLAQLASFTNVEQAIKLNQKLDALLARTSASEAAAFLGKEVQALDGSAAGIVSAVETGPSGTFVVLANGHRFNSANGFRVVAQ
jgi:flagellar basal-body rod modification protein FlgD